jgi:hypothetical protein
MHALLWSVVLGGGLQLGDISDVGGCRLDRHVPEALARVLPTLPLGRRPTTGGDIFISVAATPPDGARLRLTNARGNVLLARDLPVALGLCDSVADIIALITERYLRDIGWQPSADGLPEVPRGTRVVPREPQAFRWAPHLEGLDVGARATGEWSGEMRWGGALWLRLPLGAWETSLGVTGLEPTTQAITSRGVPRGEIRVWSLEMQVAAGVCAGAAGGHQLCADFLSGGEWLFGSTRGGGIFRDQAATQSQPLVAWEARYEYGVGENPLAVLVAARATLRPWGAGFSVRDADAGYRSPGWTISIDTGFWWQAL